jgi:glycosyltransferase involved in cell wall biosynthesis
MKYLVNLLVVGPLPPPPVGGTVSFQLFCEYIERRPELLGLSIVDSSPKRLKQTRAFSVGNLPQAWFVLRQFFRQVKSAHQVLIFGSNGFLLSMAPVLLLFAKIAGKPCYIRPFGGSLDSFSCQSGFPARVLLQTMLWLVDGLIVQTKLLYDSFLPVLGNRVHLVSGYREIPSVNVRPVHSGSDGSLRLVYVGNIREEKGIFVLFESLRNLNTSEQSLIQCDLFGVILDNVATRFKEELAKTRNARYGGVLDPEKVVATLANYDVMIFPTYYQGEGHPGVLIEAMMAGIPVITTGFRSIPELVEDKVNGLLVLPRDAGSLTEAIRTVHYDRAFMQHMAEKNWKKRLEYDVERVVPLILQAISKGIE